MPVVVNEHLHTNLMMRRPITGGGELAQRLLEVQLLEQLFLYPQWHPAGKSGRLYAQKLTGGMPDFSWLLQMSRRQGGFLSSRTLEKSGAITSRAGRKASQLVHAAGELHCLAGDLGARERGVGHEQEALPRAIIDHHQDAEATPVDELIGPEVERPAFIWNFI